MTIPPDAGFLMCFFFEQVPQMEAYYVYGLLHSDEEALRFIRSSRVLAINEEKRAVLTRHGVYKLGFPITDAAEKAFYRASLNGCGSCHHDRQVIGPLVKLKAH